MTDRIEQHAPTSPKAVMCERKRSPNARLVPRRDFLRVSSAGLGFAAMLATERFAAADFAAGHYVDVHTHLGQTWNTTKPLSADVLLAWMDQNDISQAVVLPLVSPESSSYLLTTDFVLTQTRPHRDRLIPFCSIDPRTSYSGGLRGLVDMLKRYVDEGARGFGEHKPGVKIDDPRNMTIYAACGELKLPVLFHLDEQRNMDAPGLPGLESALKQHPHTQFIGHGPGWWASISGEVKQADLARYPDGPVSPGGAIDALNGQVSEPTRRSVGWQRRAGHLSRCNVWARVSRASGRPPDVRHRLSRARAGGPAVDIVPPIAASAGRAVEDFSR